MANLILQINIFLRIAYAEELMPEHMDIIQTSAVDGIYVAIRFFASSYYAEKINEEVSLSF